MPNTIELGSLNDAREFAREHGGRYLVLSPEILVQIEAAESLGGFEGGMSGASGQGGYSASGSDGSGNGGMSDPSQPVPLDPDFYFWRVGAFIEGVAEGVLTVKDVIESFKGVPLGPVILVPKKELDRWLNGSSGDGA